jgi:hypothetical protein
MSENADQDACSIDSGQEACADKEPRPDKTAEEASDAKVPETADEAYEDGQFALAVIMYEEKLENDPRDYRAMLFSAIAQMYCTTIDDCKIGDVSDAAKRSFAAAYAQLGDSKDFFLFVADAIEELSDVIYAMTRMFLDHFRGQGKHGDWSMLKEQFRSCSQACIDIDTCVLDIAPDFSYAPVAYFNRAFSLAKDCRDYRQAAEVKDDMGEPAFKKRLLEIVEPAQEAHYERYMEEHPAERERLETLKAQIEERKAEWETTRTAQAKTGLFDFKGKKAIKGDFDRIKEDIRLAEEEIALIDTRALQ